MAASLKPQILKASPQKKLLENIKYLIKIDSIKS